MPARTLTPRRWKNYPQARRIYSVLFVGIAAMALCQAAYYTVAGSDEAAAVTGRKLMSGGGVEVVPGLNGECNYENENAGNAFGFSLLYVLVNVYLFLGIAIICDNQFTAALEMICSEFGLDLNPDVAGATFMAAGSSAPELATSFVGTFLSDSNVGVGTIIGSAVFNILVIVGATAILSKKALELDWRPVVRDNFFYLISVIILIIVIKSGGGGTDEINTVDSVILLVWYTCYILYMAINERMILKFCPHEEDPESDEETPGETTIDARGKADERSETPADVVVQTDSHPKLPSGTGGIELEASPAAANSDETLKPREPRKRSLPSHHYWHHQHPEKDLDVEDVATDHDSEEEEEEDGGVIDMISDALALPWELLFKYTMPDCFYPFELIDAIEDKLEDKYYGLGGLFDEPYPEGMEGDNEAEEGKTYDEMRQAEFRSMPADSRAKLEMLDNQIKRKTQRKRQLDKIKKKETKDLSCGQRWFWATFFVSLLHITWMSYFMVEFMVKIGCLWHISDTVMGLTFLAMGTSIPDALGSLAVAAKGEGDMAVSNAVGSNVFDICMGLGLPWFIKCVAGSGPVKIDDTDTIIPSIIILVAIIVLLFSTFAVCKWRLIPQVGYVLLTAYILFVIYSLVYEAVK